jgi:uncharacterized membrane protein
MAGTADMIDIIIKNLSALPREVVTFILAILPISEVRGAIPFGLISGLGLAKTLTISIFGNIIFIAPTLFLLEPVSNYLRRFWVFKRFFDWLFERTKKKATLVEQYETVGLMIFVAVPLPLTGAWTGCIAASLFKIRFKYAFLAVSLGVIIAAAIVTAVCLVGKGVLYNVIIPNY